MSVRITITVCALLLSGCSGASSVPDELKVGLITPLTGASAASGAVTLQAVTQRIDDMNAAGGIDGKIVRLLIEDGDCEGYNASRAAQRLVNVDAVDAVIAADCSEDLVSIRLVLDPLGIPLIPPTADSTEIIGILKTLTDKP